jgi:hypothetical protein
MGFAILLQCMIYKAKCATKMTEMGYWHRPTYDPYSLPGGSAYTERISWSKKDVRSHRAMVWSWMFDVPAQSAIGQTNTREAQLTLVNGTNLQHQL